MSRPTRNYPVGSPDALLAAGDRGAAEFFHGRQNELRQFQKALFDAKRKNGGTTYLVQGPPGAGKTALLHECREWAKRDGWGVAKIYPSALHDRSNLASELGESYVTKKTRRVGIDGQVGIGGWLQGLFRGLWGLTLNCGGRHEKDILKRIAKRRGLVLILDEAQDVLQTGQISKAINDNIRKNLQLIHNGDIGAPVILLAGGLGTSQSVLGTFGISRFTRHGVHLLGSLSDTEGQAVIRDWLVYAGGVPTDHRHLRKWINTLADECHGWPQHLIAYAQTAAEWLNEDGHEIEPEVPLDLLAEARATKVDYYLARVIEFDRPQRSDLANLLVQKGRGKVLTRQEVSVALQPHLSEEQAREMFDEFLHKGVIAKTADGEYIVPIPSMHDWLVERYADRTPELPPALPAKASSPKPTTKIPHSRD